MTVVRDTIWEMEPHTAAKHRILERYLGAWFPVMASSGFRGRIIFLDGFAGPGIYKNGEPGSPIIALRTLLQHPHFPRWSRSEFVFGLFESDRDRHESLVQQIESLRGSWSGGWPQNVGVRIENTTFEAGAEGILASVHGAGLAPTFAFVDPFGFSGAPMSLIGRLLAFDGCEVFFNVIADHVNRFVTHPDDQVTDHIKELFGTDRYLDASTLAGEARMRFLHDLYREQLRTTAGFTYVTSFRMKDARKDAMLAVSRDPQLAGSQEDEGGDVEDRSRARRAVLRSL